MAVTKEDINDALRGKEDRLDIADWRRIVGQYPYCEIFVWHYLRTLYRAGDVMFDKNVVMSAKNIPSVKTTLTNTINVYDILNAKKLVLTQDAVKTIEEVYA